MQRFSHPILALAVLTTAAALTPLQAANRNERALKERLAQAELLAGITAVSGPGIVVTLRHSPRTAPAGVDAASLRISERDVTAVMNALRGAGAEALAVAGAGGVLPERVIATTAVRDTAEGILVNGAPLQPPYRILAIGEAPRFRADLFRDGGVVKSAALDTLQMIEIEEATRVVVPGYRQTAGFRFARPLEAPQKAEGPNSSPMLATAPTPAAVPVPADRSTPKKPVATLPTGEKAVIAYAGLRTPRPLLTGQLEPELGEGTSIEPAASPRPEDLPAAPAPARAETKPAVPKVEPRKPEPARPMAPKPAAAPAAKTAPAATPASGAPVFAGEKQAKYHRSGCRVLDRIPAEQRTRFADSGEAERSGREACALCTPAAKADR